MYTKMIEVMPFSTGYSGVQTCEIRTSTTLSPLHKIFAIDTVPQLREYRYILLKRVYF